MARFIRSGGHFLKPEGALKRSDELLQVGQKNAALQTLHDVITSKRYRTWQKVLEQIMFKYVDLCIELKKGRHAKDGLIHYRNICQQVNVQSLEEVIKYYLKTTTDRAEEAQSKAKAALEDVEDVEDLEADARPEDLMMSYVSGEKGKDRLDRELVTPWFKFLWETYRTVLDILRNNSRLEALYAMTATKAFQFCLTYKRTTEFRRLCDILRNHLVNLNKYRDQRDRPDLGNPESMQLYLDTRFEQLKVACDLELWQEAFRSVEDLQGLLAMKRKPAKPQMMATYYAKLTKIFSVSGSRLYNGYAWYKLFNLSKTYNKGLTQTDMQMMACSVLLAALSILPYDGQTGGRSEADAELDKERSMRMATILGFAVDAKRDARNVLARTALVGELASKGVGNLVPDEIKQILTLLEGDFVPLELCHRLQPLLETLGGLSKPMSGASPVVDVGLEQYTASLQQVAVLRLLQQLSQVYSVMRVDSLEALVPFMGFSDVEQLIVDAVKHDFLQVRIDHKNGTVHFGAPQLESEQLQDHLSTLSKRLSRALTMTRPERPEDHEARRIQAIQQALQSAQQDNVRANARKLMIERRKEEAERRLMQAEEEAERSRMMQLKATEQAEEERRRKDMIKREEDRIKRELEEKELQEAEELLAKAAGKRRPRKDGEKLDKQALMQEAMEEQQKARIEQRKRMEVTIKRMDHLERARREVEAPLLQEQYAESLKLDEVEYAQQRRQFAAQHRTDWEAAKVSKDRLAKMLPHKEEFQQQIMKRRADEFADLKRAREEEIEERKAMRRHERDVARKREFVRRVRVQIEERRAEQEEEEMRQEAERMQREADLKKEQEAERLRKLEEAAEKQRQREKEIEERAKKDREEAILRRPAPAATAAPSGGGGGGYLPPTRRTGGYAPPSARAREEAPPARSGEEPSRWGRREGAPAAGADRPERSEARQGERPAEEDKRAAWAPSRTTGPGAAPTAGSDNKWRPRGAKEGAEPPRDAAPPPAREERAPVPRAGGEREPYRPRAFGDRRDERPRDDRRDDRERRDDRRAPPPAAPRGGGSRW